MKKLLATAALAALIATPALADNTDTATVLVGGTVVASLTASATGITMPDVVAPGLDVANATVTLNCSTGAGVVSYTGNSNPFANGIAGATAVPGAGSANVSVVGANSTGTCSTVTVGGEALFNYAIVVGSTFVDPGAVAGVTLTGSNCQVGTGTRTLDGTGADTFTCGATITVAGGSAATGVYSAGSYDVAVTYD